MRSQTFSGTVLADVRNVWRIWWHTPTAVAEEPTAVVGGAPTAQPPTILIRLGSKLLRALRGVPHGKSGDHTRIHPFRGKDVLDLSVLLLFFGGSRNAKICVASTHGRVASTRILDFLTRCWPFLKMKGHVPGHSQRGDIQDSHGACQCEGPLRVFFLFLLVREMFAASPVLLTQTKTAVGNPFGIARAIPRDRTRAHTHTHTRTTRSTTISHTQTKHVSCLNRRYTSGGQRFW